MRIEVATRPERQRVWLHLLGLAIFSSALYLPLLGRGFIHDDFVWLNEAAHLPWGYEFSHPSGTVALYSPLTLLTFRLDWGFWGLHPFPYAVENLALHIANTFLVYGLALLLWRTLAAAWWAGFGFALLYTANVWAVMWIATRAHLLVTLFYTAALCATVWFARTLRYRFLAAIATLALAATAMFSKENGVTLALAIPVLLWFEQRRGDYGALSRRAVVSLMAGLLAVTAAYIALRARSGALSVSWSSHASSYQYKLSSGLLADNLSHYVGWTYGLLAVLALALAASLWIRGTTPRLAAVTPKEALLSFFLFLIALAPIVFLPGRSGIYSYLPGMPASLLLGAVVRSQDPAGDRARNRLLSVIPVVAVIVVYVAFARGQAQRWKHMAEDDTAVLDAIHAQLPHPATGTCFVLRYDRSDRDEKSRFHDGFASWGFSPALQLLYANPTIKGAVIGLDEPLPKNFTPSTVEFVFRHGATIPASSK